jgi:hypothetical protein
MKRFEAEIVVKVAIDIGDNIGGPSTDVIIGNAVRDNRFHIDVTNAGFSGYYSMKTTGEQYLADIREVSNEHQPK